MDLKECTPRAARTDARWHDLTLQSSDAGRTEATSLELDHLVKDKDHPVKFGLNLPASSGSMNAPCSTLLIRSQNSRTASAVIGIEVQIPLRNSCTKESSGKDS